jgi:hypothetical protein
MGHIVNPVSYRLGASRCWNSVWPNDMSLTMSYSTLMKSDWDLFLFFKRFFDLKLIMQSGYIFSHVKVIRDGSKTSCIVYFYDGGSLERSDNMKQILMSRTSQLFSIRNMFFISLYSFLKLYQWNVAHTKLLRNFKFSLLFNFFARKQKFLKFKKYLRFHFLNSLNFILDSLLNFFLVLEPVKHWNFINIILEYFHSLNFDSTTLKFKYFFDNLFNYVDASKDFLINIFSSVCFFFFKFNFSEKNFKSIFNQKLSRFFLLLRWKMFKRGTFIAKMIRCGYHFLSFSRYFLHYFADNFFFYFRIKTRLIHSIKHVILFIDKKKMGDSSKFKIILKKLEVSEVNAAIMSKYLAIRLRQRFQLKEALLPMLRHLSNNEYVRGFRIVCAGRFTRKEIALYDLRTYSSVPFSGVTAKLDFALSEVVLKYSICGIKVWLHRYCLPQREHGFVGIGMNFMLPPPMHETFAENLSFIENFRHIPFRFEDSTYAMVHKKSDVLYKRSFVRFATKLGPTYDFIFFKYTSIPPELKSEIAEAGSLNTRELLLV